VDVPAVAAVSSGYVSIWTYYSQLISIECFYLTLFISIITNRAKSKIRVGVVLLTTVLCLSFVYRFSNPRYILLYEF